MKRFAVLPALIAALCLAVPVSGFGKHKITVYRDLDGDGHFNKKTFRTGYHHRDSGRRYHGYYGYHRPYYYHSPSYFGYRPYYYGYPRSTASRM